MKTRIRRTGACVMLGATEAAPEAASTGPRNIALPRGYRRVVDHRREDVAYRPAIDGVMYACGHAAHLAIGLAVAKRMLAEHEQLQGNLKVAFQHAEQGGNGALAINEGMQPPSPPRPASRVRLSGRYFSS